MSASSPTRRALLGSALLAPLAAAMCAKPAVAASGASNLPSLIGAADAAEQARDHYQATVYDPARDAWKAADAALPHHTTGASFINVSGHETRFSTQSESNVATARAMCRDTPAWLAFPENADFRATCEEVVAAAAAREHAGTELKERFGLSAKWDELDRLCDAAGDAVEAVANFPARTIQDVSLKMTALAERGGLDEPYWMGLVRDDVRRLAGEVA